MFSATRHVLLVISASLTNVCHVSRISLLLAIHIYSKKQVVSHPAALAIWQTQPTHSVIHALITVTPVLGLFHSVHPALAATHSKMISVLKLVEMDSSPRIMNALSAIALHSVRLVTLPLMCALLVSMASYYKAVIVLIPAVLDSWPTQPPLFVNHALVIV